MKGIKKLNRFATTFLVLGMLGLLLSFCLTKEASLEAKEKGSLQI